MKSAQSVSNSPLRQILLELLPELLELLFQIFDFLFEFADSIRLRFRFSFSFSEPYFTGKKMRITDFLLAGLPRQPDNERPLA